MRKIMTIVGTRPELIKMSRVIHEFEMHTNHILVHTGQNADYEMNQIFFEDLEIKKPDYFLEADCSHTMNTLAKILQETDKVLEKEKPDALMIYGDTNSCLSIIAAKKRQIPIFHMEAGNRCFDQRVPEEANRKIVDHLSDINIVLTEHARRYLINEGIPGERIIKSGSHMQEVLDYYMPKICDSDILHRLMVQSKKYFLISAHREENVDSPENLQDLLDTLTKILNTYHFPIVVSTHPRTRMRLEQLGGVEQLDKRIQFLNPFGFLDYVKLQQNAFCILSDSGTIAEEASLLNLPAITIREAHERPEGMDEGTLIMSTLKSQRVLDAIRITTAYKQADHKLHVVPDYEGGIVSKKILKIVLSYIDYVNRVVWTKI